MLTTIDYYEKRLEEQAAIIDGYRMSAELFTGILVGDKAGSPRELWRKAERETVERMAA
jgi:hypothetical protein